MAIHIAASSRDPRSLDALLKHHQEKGFFDINSRNDDGWSAIHFASCLNNFDAVNLLLESGADLANKDKGKLNAYHEMVRSDNHELLKCVWPHVKRLDDDRDFDKPGSFGLIHLAANSNSPNCLLFLLEKGKASPKEICNNKERSSPLHFAVLGD